MKAGKGGFGGLLVALLFAVCFGGVGAASWAVGGTLWAAWEANSWTRVFVEVIHYESGSVQYNRR